MKHGDILSVYVNGYRRAGSELFLAEDDQLQDIVEAVVIARSAIDLSIDQDQRRAGQSHLLTVVPCLLDSSDDILPIHIGLELIHVHSQSRCLRADPLFEV